MLYKTDGTPVIAYFNSIKVQLERHTLGNLYQFQTLFQFHKGTIRTQKRARLLFLLLLFQFHKGTIRTLYIEKEQKQT